MSRRSVHLTTLTKIFSWASLTKWLTRSASTVKLSLEPAEVWPKKLFHDQSSRKYWIVSGSNSQPLDQLSNSLPTALRCPIFQWFVCLFCCFTSQVNSYGHGGTVSSPNHTFSWARFNKQLTSTSCTFACN